MIIVIADDITGAAELGGIGLRYGLRVQLSDRVEAIPGIELLVVYTNTRSMAKEEAVHVMEQLTITSRELKPSLFYKKTDSALRGHIIPEMEVQMKAMGFEKALLVPANPLLGRTIRDGEYYINGEPLHLTGFASDPEFPVNSSRVEDILREDGSNLQLVKSHQSIPKGIAIGEATSPVDISEWAKDSNNDLLFAGGAGFFEALILEHYQKKAKPPPEFAGLSKPLLMVSGTTYRANVERIKGLSKLTSYMPPKVFSAAEIKSGDLEGWSDDAVSVMQREGMVIVAVNNSAGEKTDPAMLRERMAEVTRLIIKKTTIRELIVEGGSTAFAVINRLGWHSFSPVYEMQQGIVRMQVIGIDQMHLTIKPGSYQWPAWWNFN